MLVGVSPVLSAAIAVIVLDEPLHLALVDGTLLVVGGGPRCWCVSAVGPLAQLSIGVALGLSAALLFAIRDNLVRWAARGSDVPGFVAASASLLSATLVIAIVVTLRPDARARVGRAFRPFVLSGAVYSISCASVFGARPRTRHRGRAARCDGVALGRADLPGRPAALGTNGSTAARRRCARRQRRRAHLGVSVKTPEMLSVRRKRPKKYANTAKSTIACSTAIVTPAICWSVSSQRPPQLRRLLVEVVDRAREQCEQQAERRGQHEGGEDVERFQAVRPAAVDDGPPHQEPRGEVGHVLEVQERAGDAPARSRRLGARARRSTCRARRVTRASGMGGDGAEGAGRPFKLTRECRRQIGEPR